MNDRTLHSYAMVLNLIVSFQAKEYGWEQYLFYLFDSIFLGEPS